MTTITENLEIKVGELKLLLKDLLLDHSSIYKWNRPRGGVVFITIANYAYNDLDEKGRQLQSKLLEEYRRFHSLLQVLLKEQPDDTKRELKQLDRSIINTIEQNYTSYKTTKEAYEKTSKYLQEEFQLINRLYDPEEDQYIYVPDTNGLLFNPDIENWRFSHINLFTIFLVPTVLSELDEIKISHNNENVRKKSEKLIRKIKEYRRRGSLIDGVKIVENKIYLQSLAIEPNMKETLPWLDYENNDDRMLASVIEIMRSKPRSHVILITRDINLQNKAEFASVPYDEPPGIENEKNP